MLSVGLRPTTTDKATASIRSRWIGIAFLLALTLGMFGDVLFSSKPIVLSDRGTDIASMYLFWRPFVAEQLRHGHVPLWDPYTFCGQPILGWALGGLLYPPNWLDLVVSVPRSINWGIAAHIFLAGLFTYLWALRRGLHPLAAIISGALFMFSGAYFLHVYAGHLMLLYGIAWMPLVFLSTDEWIRTRKIGWLLLGIGAVAMQLFVGDLQGCFYTALAAALLLGFQLIKARNRLRILLGFVAMYTGAAALGAVQLLTSLQAGAESVRSSGVTREFASMVSFAPENFLTLLAPGLFGDMVSAPYWGRWYLWEMCLFIGVSGFTLSVYGAACGKREHRCALVSMVVILLLLALGSNTPLFDFLYRWVPGFNHFRGNAKFIVQASLVLTMLAGAGLDRLLRSTFPTKSWAIGLLLAAFIVSGAATELRSAARAPTTNWWSHAMQFVYATRETDIPATTYSDPASITSAGNFAARRLFISAAELFVVSGLIFFARVSRKAVYALAFMAVAEVFTLARTTRASFPPSDVESPELKAFLDRHPGDYRIYYQRTPNLAMWLGKEDVWGYAPSVLKRYAEFMAFTQGQSPDNATLYINFSRFHPLHAMLRWKYAFLPGTGGDRVLTAPSAMPRLQLVQQYRVLKGRDEIFDAMASPSFDPQQQAILETEPNPATQPFADKGTVTLLESSANQLTVEVDLPHPAILVITDAYSDGWRARPLADSIQHTYDVLPANYALRAIPLSQGHHHILIEYAPIGFRVGKWITIISLAGFVLAAAIHARRSRTQPRSVLIS